LKWRALSAPFGPGSLATCLLGGSRRRRGRRAAAGLRVRSPAESPDSWSSGAADQSLGELSAFNTTSSRSSGREFSLRKARRGQSRGRVQQTTRSPPDDFGALAAGDGSAYGRPGTSRLFFRVIFISASWRYAGIIPLKVPQAFRAALRARRIWLGGRRRPRPSVRANDARRGLRRTVSGIHLGEAGTRARKSTRPEEKYPWEPRSIVAYRGWMPRAVSAIRRHHFGRSPGTTCRGEVRFIDSPPGAGGTRFCIQKTGASAGHQRPAPKAHSPPSWITGRGSSSMTLSGRHGP